MRYTGHGGKKSGLVTRRERRNAARPYYKTEKVHKAVSKEELQELVRAFEERGGKVRRP